MIWKIMPVQIIEHAVIFDYLCQSEWNYASQNRLTCYFQTSRRQKYFTGHSVWWRAIFHRTESKFARPKNLSGILTNKSQISLVSTFVCSCKHYYIALCIFFTKKLLARFVSLLLFWQKKYEMPLYAYHFSVVLHSWDHSFSASSDKHVLASYTTTRIVLLVHTCMP